MRLLPELTRRRRALRRGECGGPSSIFRRFVFEPRPTGRPRGSGERGSVRGGGPRLRAQYSMRGNAELSEWEGHPGAEAVFVGSRTHPQRARRRRRTRRPGASCRRVSTWRTSLLSHETRRCGGCSPRAAPIPRTPATPTSVYPTWRNAERFEPSSPPGRRFSTSGSSSATRESTSCSRRFARSTRGRDRQAGEATATSSSGSLRSGPSSPVLEHRHLGADPAHRRDRRSLDLPEAFGMVAAEAPPRGRSLSGRPLEARRDRGRRRRGSPEATEGARELRDGYFPSSREAPPAPSSNRKSATSSRRRPGRRSWTAGAGQCSDRLLGPSRNLSSNGGLYRRRIADTSRRRTSRSPSRRVRDPRPETLSLTTVSRT